MLRRNPWSRITGWRSGARAPAAVEHAAPAPLIGVTGPDRGGGPAWVFTWLAVRRAGAQALRITPLRPIDPALLDGLIIGGGADVTEPLPAEVDAVPIPPSSRHVSWPRRALDRALAPLVLLVRWLGAVKRDGIDTKRDVLEASLLEYADQAGLPVLGICRGAQLMNIVEGGTLMRNLHTLYAERAQLYTVLPRREVYIEHESLLRTIVGRSNLLVNSLHFHAVDRPAPGFRVTAREVSGITQAIEGATSPFWVGVQWHPEYLPQQRAHQRIFEALVNAARARRHQHHAQPGEARSTRRKP